MDYSKLNDIIKSSKNILIISHINPDGDTLGSMCGLYSAILDNYKKKCDMMSISKIPDVYSFLPHLNEVKNIEDYDKSREYDLVINVDVASLDRICDAKTLFDKAKFRVNIDHHKTNSAYGDLNFINPDASSTGEVLFNCFSEMGWRVNLDAAICLYTAILTDTGSFRFDNTKPLTFDTAGKLVEIGVQPSDIYKKVYESDSKTLVMFQAHCISKAKFLDNDKIAYTIVYKKDMEKFSAGDDCMEGLTEKLRAIVTTRIAFVAKEMKNGGTKVSMRSKFADVAEICEIFGGGGHKFAAGCTIKAPVEEAARKVLEEISKHEL
ncbi:TPA: bifunctional oligoribonuclease/PAP phosphatase NrnA [Candidatus Gastranaerophilales bacterium HUM_20]|nr:fIG146085: 3'-to-5' oligoribonuclease A Bacillus type [Clostridium sp. CAG:729]DAB22094.1 MAG TPA: bifunctional oligoribonuclease/PAP phosphatase NrnA [Candidatus Gastranaerophilales bacterium HUM_20]